METKLFKIRLNTQGRLDFILVNVLHNLLRLNMHYSNTLLSVKVYVVLYGTNSFVGIKYFPRRHAPLEAKEIIFLKQSCLFGYYTSG